MDNTIYDSQSGAAWKTKGDVTRDESRQAHIAELDSLDMQVPMAPTDADLLCDKRVQALFDNRLYKKAISGPASVTISGSSTTNYTSMSTIAAPHCPLIANTDNLSLVPMRMIPMNKMHSLPHRTHHTSVYDSAQKPWLTIIHQQSEHFVHCAHLSSLPSDRSIQWLSSSLLLLLAVVASPQFVVANRCRVVAIPVFLVGTCLAILDSR